MRIAFFCPHSDPLAKLGEPDSGGQCVYEYQVAKSLAAQGHEVRCFTRHYGDKNYFDEITRDATVYRYKMGPKSLLNEFLRKEDMGPYLAQFAKNVFHDQDAWLKSVDVIHGHYWDGGVSGLIASMAYGKPLVFTSHSLGALKQLRVPDTSADGHQFNYPIRLAAEKKVIHASDRVITLSQVEVNAQVDHYAADEKKLTIVPGGVETKHYRPMQTKTELNLQLKKLYGLNTDYVVFTIGRIDSRKGFVEFIRSMPHTVKALADKGKSVTFLMPGGGENLSEEEQAYKKRMLDAAEELGMMQHIVWFNRLSDEDVKLHYAGADLFTCPSPYEPFGLVLVEAFASATPVVATCNGGPVEIVSEGVDGYLAEPSDEQAFAEAVNKVLLEKPTQRKAMQEAALKKAETTYDWSAIAKSIASEYQQAMTQLPVS